MQRFLIVDKNEQSCMLMAMTLSKFAECAVATQGEEAIRLFERQIGQAPYDAVLMGTSMLYDTGIDDIKTMRTMEMKTGIDTADEFKLVVLTDHRDLQDLNASFIDHNPDAFVPRTSSEEDWELELGKIQLS
ncbi:hypothetical protein [Pseudodesulfovibrio sediminis]|uniref:Response regulatory domain-containing protein n=1 Tax=Pseudodesulfovibrio sediminis TaxID=2810563 RepID=A0ABM7P2V6_9BACT|nr:hypothetical protein [Pseudodesulfovibrio sediminis]BCS87105.1 hypothetical protein PSDVSF_03470 [Pseudodesulfovibrio sediminis]